MKTSHTLLIFLLTLLASPLGAQTLPVQLPSFSADVNILSKDKPFTQGKFYMSPAGVRMEMNASGMPMTVIDRLDKGVMWMLMGAQKTYMEQPLPFDPMIKHEVPAGWTQNCSDGEAIDNHPTEKCILSGNLGGKPVTTTIWKAKDLNSTVIRTVGEQGGGMELKNIVVGPQPATLFDPPAGYKKMNLPAAAAGLAVPPKH